MGANIKQKVGLPYRDNKMELIPDTDCEIVHEDGKWYVVRKEEKYPKTYAECCKVLGCKPIIGFAGLDDDEENLYGVFIALKRCRDAYWKIAGDWKPDWEDYYTKHCIIYRGEKIRFETSDSFSQILSFPAAEMCNVFCENFKDLIEQCKELL